MIPTVGYVYVTSGNTVNMRNSASSSGSIITTIPKNTKVIVWDSTQNGWFKVQYNGYTGYVMSRYIAVTEDGGICTVSTSSGSLNIRQTPSGSATVLFTAANYSTMRLLDYNSVSGWYRVANGNGSGWAVSNYLQTSALPEDASMEYEVIGTTKSATPMGFIANYESILLSVPSGVSLPLLPIVVSGHTWYKTSYGGSMGFLDGNYLNV